MAIKLPEIPNAAGSPSMGRVSTSLARSQQSGALGVESAKVSAEASDIRIDAANRATNFKMFTTAANIGLDAYSSWANAEVASAVNTYTDAANMGLTNKFGTDAATVTEVVDPVTGVTTMESRAPLSNQEYNQYLQQVEDRLVEGKSSLLQDKIKLEIGKVKTGALQKASQATATMLHDFNSEQSLKAIDTQMRSGDFDGAMNSVARGQKTGVITQEQANKLTQGIAQEAQYTGIKEAIPTLSAEQRGQLIKDFDDPSKTPFMSDQARSQLKRETVQYSIDGYLNTVKQATFELQQGNPNKVKQLASTTMKELMLPIGDIGLATEKQATELMGKFNSLFNAANRDLKAMSKAGSGKEVDAVFEKQAQIIDMVRNDGEQTATTKANVVTKMLSTLDGASPESLGLSSHDDKRQLVNKLGDYLSSYMVEAKQQIELAYKNERGKLFVNGALPVAATAEDREAIDFTVDKLLIENGLTPTNPETKDQFWVVMGEAAHNSRYMPKVGQQFLKSGLTSVNPDQIIDTVKTINGLMATDKGYVVTPRQLGLGEDEQKLVDIVNAHLSAGFPDDTSLRNTLTDAIKFNTDPKLAAQKPQRIEHAKINMTNEGAMDYLTSELEMDFDSSIFGETAIHKQAGDDFRDKYIEVYSSINNDFIAKRVASEHVLGLYGKHPSTGDAMKFAPGVRVQNTYADARDPNFTPDMWIGESYKGFVKAVNESQGLDLDPDDIELLEVSSPNYSALSGVVRYNIVDRDTGEYVMDKESGQLIEWQPRFDETQAWKQYSVKQRQQAATAYRERETTMTNEGFRSGEAFSNEIGDILRIKDSVTGVATGVLDFVLDGAVVGAMERKVFGEYDE